VKNSLRALAIASALILVGSSRADATCVSPEHSPTPASVSALLGRKPAAAATTSSAVANSGATIVGLWFTTFYAGNGPGVWDEAFEQWHADGTELAMDDAVPPSIGNVCVGVWKVAGQTISLRHFGWNWDFSGNRLGLFTLNMSITLDRTGNTYSGTYVSESYDLDGNPIPELHAEGVVRGERLTVN
jgi:hypothetical protein